MNKSRIQNICIHQAKISQGEQKELLERLTYFHTKAIKQMIDSYNLSPEDTLNIINRQ